MPYKIVDLHGHESVYLRDIRKAKAVKKWWDSYLTTPSKLVHLKRDGSVEVVE